MLAGALANSTSAFPPPAQCFVAVSATSASDAWVVGNRSRTFSNTRPVVARWNGARWRASRIPPALLPRGSYLLGIAATSASDAWTVGQSTGSPGGTLILHWNGSAWQRKATPNPQITGNVLDGALAFSPVDAWVAGEGFMLRWDGATWQISPVYPEFAGLGGSGPNDLWTFADTPQGVQAMYHWDGAGWSAFPLPNWSPVRDEIDAITSSSPTDAWAVGAERSRRTLTLHWDGRAWRRVPTPNPGPDNLLYGVSARSATDAWAVGAYETRRRAGQLSPLILHWNGRRWRVTRIRLGFDSSLRGVAVYGAGHAWAVGCGARGPLILRWSRSAWRRISAPFSVRR